jgi:hypothetical protein
MNANQAIESAKNYNLLRLINESGEAYTTFPLLKEGSSGKLKKIKEIQNLLATMAAGNYKIEAKNSNASKAVYFPFTINDQEQPIEAAPVLNLDNKTILNLSIQLAQLQEELKSAKILLEDQAATIDELSAELENCSAESLEDGGQEENIFNVFLAQAAPHALKILENWTKKDNGSSTGGSITPSAEMIEAAKSVNGKPVDLFIQRIHAKILNGQPITLDDQKTIRQAFEIAINWPTDPRSEILSNSIGGIKMFEALQK